MATEPTIDLNVVLLPTLFEDTFELLLAAHEYFEHTGREDQDARDSIFRTLYAGEMSRITMRLSSIMAWLMVRKAVFLGKMTLQEAVHGYSLHAKELCLSDNSAAREHLPAYMNFLLDESRLLYERVTRLDDMIARPSAAM